PSLGESLPPRGAFPSALPILPHVRIAVWVGRASSALPTFWCCAAAASPATVTRCLPSCCAVGGTRASAFPFRISPSAGGATRASGTRCYPSPLSASADPANAPRCCASLAADRSAPLTTAPPRAFLPGARAAQVSATNRSICHRAYAVVLANAHRCRSSRSAPVAYHTGRGRLRAILHGADPSPACEDRSAFPLPCGCTMPRSLAGSPLGHRRLCLLLVPREVPQNLANDLSHPDDVLDSTRLYPRPRRARRRLLPRSSILLLDGPVREGFDRRGRPAGAAIAPRIALVHVMGRIAAVPPPVG
ncbi:unnamed protein product, partial [Closterium sp. NIES-64]